MATQRASRNRQDRADLTRKRILHAAIREFSAHGLAGARTDAIAASAKVNKALLYYYFKSKSSLYTAALKRLQAGWLRVCTRLWTPHAARENAFFERH
jgi:AcrR family transcriptional regulator